MRISNFPLFTLRELPAEAETVSHQLILRAGLARKLAAGLYTWLPLGLRVLRKVEQIVREEMNRAGALEVLMPGVQPAELWQESGRWDKYGAELLRLQDRHQRHFCLGPTHEEVVTDWVRNEIRSYKQLPINFYQIQTKFRDEIRPRFGLMRAREFIMKDAYSFHLDTASLQQTYEVMYATYHRIFTRLGLNFRAVQADTGAIGGNASHEFHVLADSGEDQIAFASASDYAANVELAPALAPSTPRQTPTALMQVIDTPKQQTIEQVSQFLAVSPAQTLKTLIVCGVDNSGVVALVLRGDHTLNTIKAEKLPAVSVPLQLASAEQIHAAVGCLPGSVGPVGLTIPVIADYSALNLHDFVCGANVDGQHLIGVNWGRDLPEAAAADLRNVVVGDPSPDGQGTLSIARGIEVGHIFQLGTRYSAAMKATVVDASGKAIVMPMGCYGIGISRIVAAAIEQNHDARGIIWPQSMAPFQLVLLPMNMHKSQRLQAAVEALYQQLLAAGVETLLDDRPLRPGAMFADAELMGIPHRLVCSEAGLDNGTLEYKGRADVDSTLIARDAVLTELAARGVGY